MQHSDRLKVLQACSDCASQKIVIVHGTDTMPETAKMLGHAALGKTIVLTGAMIPYEFDDSDAFFNFGFAVAAARIVVLWSLYFYEWPGF